MQEVKKNKAEYKNYNKYMIINNYRIDNALECILNIENNIRNVLKHLCSQLDIHSCYIDNWQDTIGSII